MNNDINLVHVITIRETRLTFDTLERGYKREIKLANRTIPAIESVALDAISAPYFLHLLLTEILHFESPFINLTLALCADR